VAPTSDGLLSFEVVGGSAERVEFLMTYEDAALLHIGSANYCRPNQLKHRS
jgi:hypothetical protein